MKKKKKIPGIVYLSSIPTKMNVKIIRDYLGDFGAVDRIFLQPEGILESFSDLVIIFKILFF